LKVEEGFSVGWRDAGRLRAELGTEFVRTGDETVLIATAAGSEVEVPLLDLREFLVLVEWPLVGDNPFGVAYEQLHHEAARMRRRIEWERRRAPGQLAELLARPESERAGAVEALGAPTFSLAELALQRSRELVHTGAERSRELARLGRAVAERVPEDVYGAGRVADLRGYAWAVYGNALRVGGELSQSTEAFAEAHRWLQEGSGCSVEAIQVLELEVSLLRDNEDFAGALAQSSELLAAYEASGRIEDMARAMVTRSSICELMGEAEQAVELLERADYLGSSTDDLGLQLWIRHALIVALARIGRIGEAAELLQDSWGLYEQFARPAVLARRHWAQGLIALGRAAAGEAADQLARARRIFAGHGYLIDTALVTLELAVALAERFRWDRVEMLAAETLVLLDGQPVHREALAALRMLQEAGARRKLDRALGRELLQRVRLVAEQRPMR
jgi:tetratricopeptide (TPR) repeat protein